MDGSVWQIGVNDREVVQSWSIDKHVELTQIEDPVSHDYTHYLVSQDTKEKVLAGPWSPLALDKLTPVENEDASPDKLEPQMLGGF